MKPLNVYDAINKDRLLGTHPRWAARDSVGLYATCARMGAVSSYPGSLMYVSAGHGPVPIMDVMTVDTVELVRFTKVSKCGWEAEVALSTFSPLEHLMRLKDFCLPGEEPYEAQRRRECW